MCPPHSPTRMTKNSILKFSGFFHCPKTSRIRFCAFSYSTGDPCGRSNQLITYFIAILPERDEAPGRTFFLTRHRSAFDEMPGADRPATIPRRVREAVHFQEYGRRRDQT